MKLPPLTEILPGLLALPFGAVGGEGGTYPGFNCIAYMSFV